MKILLQDFRFPIDIIVSSIRLPPLCPRAAFPCSYFVKMRLGNTPTNAQAFRPGRRCRGPGLARPANRSLLITPSTSRPMSLKLLAHRTIKTIAYNRQVPGPLLRFKEGQPVTVDVTNQTGRQRSGSLAWPLPAPGGGWRHGRRHAVDPGWRPRSLHVYPAPCGLPLVSHPRLLPARICTRANTPVSTDFCSSNRATIRRAMTRRSSSRCMIGTVNCWPARTVPWIPVYEVSTINGRVLGFGEPLRVKSGEQVLLHILNSSPTEVHWIALSGHQFKVIALDGNHGSSAPGCVYAPPGSCRAGHARWWR